MYNKRVETFISRPSNAHELFSSLSKFNITEINDLVSDIFGHVYWIEKGAKWTQPNQNKWYVARCHKLISILKSLLDKNWFKPETNSRGNMITREKASSIAMFYLENVNSEPGQYLYNEGLRSCITLPQELKIISYSEGDVTIVTCPDQESFDSEIEAIIEWEREYA